MFPFSTGFPMASMEPSANLSTPVINFSLSQVKEFTWKKPDF